MKTNIFPPEPPFADRRAFTLTELLVVAAIFVLLAIMLQSALANTKPDMRSFQCLIHLKQLQQGCLMYAGDNSDVLIRNSNNLDTNSWVDQSQSRTNQTQITRGLLWPYVKRLEAYKCPADLQLSPGGLPTLRSMSMNGWVGPVAGAIPYNVANIGDPRGKVFRKLSDFNGLASPAMIFVLVDEDPQTIGDGWFGNDCFQGTAEPNTWVDIPATFHNNASGLSYADGHAEFKKWSDPAVLVQTEANFSFAGQRPPTDLNWLQRRTSIIVQ
jgi:prepilin-type N-terminal cleavage/methylation domain-containing protein/prepilin-type processing-associated H-X9-DG protein